MSYEKNFIPNDELCHYIDESKIIAYGMSASIYKIKDIKDYKDYKDVVKDYKDYVLKEIYIKKNLSTSPKRNEYLINEYILTKPELQKYTVKYYGASECPPIDNRPTTTLLLKFEFIKDKTLFNQLTEFKVDELKNIFEKLRYIISLFNKEGITHNDLNSKNIFYNPKTKKLLLNDWGEGKLEYKNEDMNFWEYTVIKNELILQYFLKNNKYEDFMKFLKRTKIGEPKDGFKSTDSLFYYFKKSLKDKVRKRLINNYKPQFFINQLEELTIKVILEEMLSIKSYKDFIYRNARIPKDIKVFLKI